MPPRRSTRSKSATRRASSQRTAPRNGSTLSPRARKRTALRSSSRAPAGGSPAWLTSLRGRGVPVESKALSGQDSLYSIVQMPPGVPVGTLAIGQAGAINAALLAASVLALSDDALSKRLEAWRARQTAAVADRPKDGA